MSGSIRMPALRRLLAGVGVVGLSLVALGSSSSSALRHNQLVKAEPAVNATIAKSPSQIRLWFKEAAEVKVSSIKLTNAAGASFPVGAAVATDDPKSIAAAVTETLAAGAYTVTWKTSSRDGHVIRGNYTFTLAP